MRAELARFGAQAGMPELVEKWPRVVGPAIARNAWPARIARDGTVHVNTADSVWAFELTHRAAEMAERLGVEKLRLAPGPLPEPSPEHVASPVEATPEEVELARALASPIEEKTLRETVQKAIGLTLARARSTRPI